MPVIRLASQGVTLDHATLRHVTINVGDFGWPPPKNNFATAISGTRIEQSKIMCTKSKPTSGVIRNEPAETERWRRKGILQFIRDIDLARRLGALSSSNIIEEGCQKMIDLYLSDNCKKGFQDAGFAYECPASVTRALQE